MTLKFSPFRACSNNFRSRKTSFIAFIIAFALAGAVSVLNCAQAPASYAQVRTDKPAVAIAPDLPNSGDISLNEIIARAGARHGVDPQLIHAVIWRESNYRNDVTSPRGAGGLMQLIPETARRFGCRNAHDREANVEAGTRLLRYLLTRFNGDVQLTLAGYNAGEGSVARYNGVPPFNETQQYVRAVIARYGRTQHPALVASNTEAREGEDMTRLARTETGGMN